MKYIDIVSRILIYQYNDYNLVNLAGFKFEINYDHLQVFSFEKHLKVKLPVLHTMFLFDRCSIISINGLHPKHIFFINATPIISRPSSLSFIYLLINWEYTQVNETITVQIGRNWKQNNFRTLRQFTFIPRL